QRILTIGQREIGVIDALHLGLDRVEDDEVGLLRRFGRARGVAAVVIADRGVRQGGLQRLQRRRETIARREQGRERVGARRVAIDAAPRNDLRRAAADRDALVGVAADDRDRLRRRRE